ncbi:hypothetical protein DITRI_Ditri01bG0164300 [Diplodiscus trichospermus]
MGGGSVMRAAGKVAGFGIVNTTLRGGVQVTPPSAEYSVMRVVAPRSASSAINVSSGGVSSVAETTVSDNQKVSWEMVNDWEFAGGVEEEVALEGSTSVFGGREPMAQVLFGGVPSLEETKEATSDLKDALDKVYLLSPKSADTAAQASGLSLLSNPEETKDCVACHVNNTSVPKPAIQAFKLLKESPAVQSVVASIAADPNVWNAVLQNSAYMEFILSQKTNDEFKHQGSTQSSDSSMNVEEHYFDASQPKDRGKPFSDFLQNIKTSVVEMVISKKKSVAEMVISKKKSVVEMVSKATDFIQSLYALPSAQKGKENGGLDIIEKTIGASIMGLVVMVIMIVLLKRV